LFVCVTSPPEHCMVHVEPPVHESVQPGLLHLRSQVEPLAHDAAHELPSQASVHFDPLMQFIDPESFTVKLHVAASHCPLPLASVRSVHVAPLLQLALHELLQLPAQC
jgi:hypothetical protein